MGSNRRAVRGMFPAFVVCAALASPGAGSGRAQQALTASVDIVRLNVAVSAAPGTPVPRLHRDDFRVYDNGVLQEIDLIWRSTEVPLHVALLFDASPSIRPWWISVRRAAVTFLAGLQARDCPYVLPFAETIGRGQWGMHTGAWWMEFLTGIELGAGTALHDAVIIALSQLALPDEIMAARARKDAVPAGSDTPNVSSDADRPAVRTGPEEPTQRQDPEREDISRETLLALVNNAIAKLLPHLEPTHIPNCNLPGQDAETAKALILLSDGADTASTTRFEEVTAAARLANVPVFPVLLGAANNNGLLRQRMHELARATGGLVTTDVAPGTLVEAYADVLAYLRATYVLSYTPSFPDAGAGGGAWHDVRVEVRRPLLRTIVRPGYSR